MPKIKMPGPHNRNRGKGPKWKRSHTIGIPSGDVGLTGRDALSHNPVDHLIEVPVANIVIQMKGPTVPASGITPPDIVVNKSGSGHYTTIQAAVNNVSEGQVIEIQSDPAGSTETFTENLDFTSIAGTSSQPITIRARVNDAIILTASSGDICNVADCSYIIFDGQNSDRTGLSFADPDNWNPNSSGGTNGPYARTVYGDNAHHITFKNCGIFGGGTVSPSSRVQRNCHHWKMQNVEVSRHGTVDASSGDVMRWFAGNSVWEDCLMRWGGHNTVQVFAARNVFRRCDWSGDWTAQPTTYDGARCVTFGPANYSQWSNQAVTDDRYDFGPLLAEDSRFIDPGISQDPTAGNENASHTQLSGYHMIFRGNLYRDTEKDETKTNSYAPWYLRNTNVFGTTNVPADYPNPAIGMNRWYHNTTHNTWGILHSYVDYQDYRGAGGPYTSADHTQYGMINNVHSEVHENFNTSTTGVIDWDQSNSILDSWDDRWRGFEGRGNIYHAASDNNRHGVTDPYTSGTFVSFAEIEIDWPYSGTMTAGQWGDNDDVSSINFNNINDFSLSGWTITSGTGYQDAKAITFVTTTGNGPALPVKDGAWFYDGENASRWDLADLGEENDYIAVGATLGSATIVQIQSISADFKTINLKNSISYSNGDGVWFAGNPNSRQQLWDNRGAGQ